MSPLPDLSSDTNALPTPYAGKFDPKAIVKKASSASTGITKLGTDIALPDISKTSATLNSTHSGLKANNAVASATTLRSKRNLSKSYEYLTDYSHRIKNCSTP